MKKCKFIPQAKDFTALTLNRDDMAAMMGLTRWNLVYRYKHGFSEEEREKLNQGLLLFQKGIETFRKKILE